MHFVYFVFVCVLFLWHWRYCKLESCDSSSFFVPLISWRYVPLIRVSLTPKRLVYLNYIRTHLIETELINASGLDRVNKTVTILSVLYWQFCYKFININIILYQSTEAHIDVYNHIRFIKQMGHSKPMIPNSTMLNQPLT